jgi:hypothetical protein
MSWGPQPISDEVRRELGRFGPAGGMAEIVEAWPAAVGDNIARNAWPARVTRDGTLLVNTSSSAWAFELGLLETEIAGRLREALGAEAPKGLRFAPGRLPEPARETSEDGPPKRRAPSEAEQRMGQELAAPIEDGNLREIVAKAAAASLAKAR